MAIKQTKYVVITSGVIGASAVAQRLLTGLRFTTDGRVPVGSLLQFIDAGAVLDYFGAASTEYAYAVKYFGYVSPAPISKAPRLLFAAHAPSGRVPTIYGARTETTLAQFNAITAGTLNIQLGDTPLSLTGINLAGAANLAAVATLVQTAIRTGTGQYATATVAYDALTGAFTIAGTTIANAQTIVTTSASPNDLGTKMFLAAVGSSASPGVTAQTMLDAFRAAENVSDSFGSISFNNQGDLTEVTALALYIQSENVKYQFYVKVDATTAPTFYAALQTVSSTGLILNKSVSQYLEALPQAIMAATDYQRRNATVNYMYRQGSFINEVTSTSESDGYDIIRTNYYGSTAIAGQQVGFFQRGFLMGTATSPLDMNVHANEQWLKSFLTSALLNMQLTTNKIPTNLEGAGLVRSAIMEGVDLARFNGTISIEKTFTQTQKTAIFQLTGDPDAWHDVQSGGYWLDVVIVLNTSEPSQVESYVAKYTLAYAKNDVVRKIEGSNNLI